MRHNLLFVYGLACAFLAPAAIAQSPAEIGIRKAQALVAAHPDHYAYYNGLAMAYARRARETSDVAFYKKAEETLARSFAIAPGNFEGQKVETWLLLGRHEFARALELASKLNRQTPDDITVYGYLVDANAELGNYDDAVKAAQWMLNLRPGNVAGLTRAAYLRELHGYLAPAMELMQMAYDATPFQESEDRAWLLTQMAHLELLAGDLPKAEMYANGALGLYAGYHYALGALAQVRIAQHRFGEAVDLLRKECAEAPHPENLYALGDALMQAGRKDEAESVFRDFERAALRESTLADNANRELIAWYADYAGRPADALRLAKLEMERRHDVYTIDSYAWALAANGDYRLADTVIRKALALGVRDPKILRHAELIEHRLTARAAI